VLPSIVFYLDDFSKTFVIWEFTINSFKIFLMELEDIQEAFHTEFVPPVVLLHDREASSKDVSNITSTTNIGRKGTIGDSDKNGSSVIKNNVKLFNWLNCFFNFSNWVTNFL